MAHHDECNPSEPVAFYVNDLAKIPDAIPEGQYVWPSDRTRLVPVALWVGDVGAQPLIDVWEDMVVIRAALKDASRHDLEIRLNRARNGQGFDPWTVTVPAFAMSLGVAVKMAAMVAQAVVLIERISDRISPRVEA